MAGVAHADPVPVTVTEVAGDVAYLDAGRAKGVRKGSKVTIGAHAFVVLEVTETTAAIQLDAAVAPGDRGTVEPAPEARAKPRPPEAFVEQWPPSKRPAEDQRPSEIALGKGRGERATRLAFQAYTAGTISSSGVTGEGDIRGIASFDVLHDRPLGMDLDVAARAFTDGYNAEERTPLLVRAAQLRYGDVADPSLMVGRLAYATTSVGMLDGGRAAFHGGDFELAAFGGIEPDADSGHPDSRASRFGVEAIYDGATAPWQPRVAVVAHGSTWNDKLDERRLSAAGSAHAGSTYVDGWLEVEQFPAGNPWNAPSVQVTGAGASADWRTNGAHLGVDATFLRPERSLRLDALLPPTWACTRAAQPGNAVESCLDIDEWSAVSISGGINRPRWAVDVLASAGQTQGQSTYADGTLYARGEWKLGVPRVFAALSGGSTSFATWEAIEAGAGIALPRFDASLSYRPERLDYTTTGALLQHSLVADLHVAPSRALDVVLSLVGTTGDDRDVLAAIATLAWRLR